MEDTVDLYDPQNNTQIDWKDPDIVTHQTKLVKKKQLEKLLRREVLGLGEDSKSEEQQRNFEKERNQDVESAVERKKDSLK